MRDKARITVLVENWVGTRGLKAEHGLAWLVETKGGGCGGAVFEFEEVVTLK